MEVEMRKPQALTQEWMSLGWVHMVGESEAHHFLAMWREQKRPGDWINVVLEAVTRISGKKRYRIDYSRSEKRFARGRDWNILVAHDPEVADALLGKMTGEWSAKLAVVDVSDGDRDGQDGR
jgi:hypothetical protein